MNLLSIEKALEMPRWKEQIIHLSMAAFGVSVRIFSNNKIRVLAAGFIPEVNE